jgi:succinate dehydrogenase / fumarate reductase cytochrome b subunit
MDCCGFGIRKADKELSLLVINNKLESIQKTKANCIVVACPACFQQFDFNQRDLNKRNGNDFNYPTFFLSELVALAFGFSYDELGLKFHHTKVKQFLQSIEFLK